MKKKIKTLLATLFFTTSLFGQNNDLFMIIEHNKIGYINNKGVVIIEPKFKAGSDFSDGLASVRWEGQYGYIDQTGKFVIQPKYDYAINFTKGISCVYINGVSRFIDKNEQTVLDKAYRSIHLIKNRQAIVTTTSQNKGIIDLDTKKLILDTIYNYIYTFDTGVATATKRNKDGYTDYSVFDTWGNLIVPPGRYKQISGFIDGYSSVVIKDPNNDEGIDGVIDRKGNLLFQKPRKNNCAIKSDFHDGLAIISLYKYWILEDKGVLSTSDKSYEGYINLKGEVILNDTSLKYLKDFSNNRTFIKDSEQGYKLVDTRLNQVSKDVFDDILNDGFKNGFAIIKKKNRWGIIDTNGKYVVEPEFEYIDKVGIIDNYFFYGIDVNNYENLLGIADIKGNIITQPIIQEFNHQGFVNGLLKTIINNRLTYIDQSGNIIWQEKKIKNRELQYLDIDYMNRGYFYAHSKPDEKDLGGFGGSPNAPRLIKNKIFEENKLSVVVNTQTVDTFQQDYKAYKVTIANLSGIDILFNAQDSRLYMKVQAKDKDGQWKDIEYLPSSWCGNSYHTLTLEKNNYWTFATPVYSGAYKTRLRIALSYIDPSDKSEKRRDKKALTIYSNEYEGSINPGQFWNKREYNPRGIMDPYYD